MRRGVASSSVDIGMLRYLGMTSQQSRPQSSHRAKRGNYAPSLARKEAISAAVLDIVDASGYDAVTIGQVSKATGIPQSSVLYHFPTRDHLLVGAMESAAQAITADELDKYGLPADPIIWARDMFRAVLGNRNRLLLEVYLRGLASQPDNPAHGYLLRRGREAVDWWTQLCKQLQDAHQMHAGLDPHTTAVQIVSLISGLMEVSAYSDGSNDERICDDLVTGIRCLTCRGWQEFLAYANNPASGR